MNKFAVILCGLLFFQSGFAESHDQKNSARFDQYEDYFGYFLESLTYAHYLHPHLAIPKILEVSAGYYAMLGARDLAKAARGHTTPVVVRTWLETLYDIGFSAAITGGNMAGYAVHGTFAPYALSATVLALEHLLPISGYFNAHLAGLQNSYELSEFSDVTKRRHSYLACSYMNHDDPTENFKIWAQKDLLASRSGLQNLLKFRHDTVVIDGRWILVDSDGKSTYVFGTIVDPLLLQSACIEAVASYAQKNNIDLRSSSSIRVSSGQTFMANSYQIRFFHPTLLKSRKWSKMKPLITRRAVLLDG